ncbi:MAG: FAD-dependent oxidoreductase [Chloroflexi bacterium]|nr:FAD-dependent oxidoreductase [Chloroflexota bacterium]
MKLVIVGNGIAGTTSARLVTERDASVDVEVFTDEPYLYYPRPKLIDFLAGKVETSAMPQYGEDWYQKRGIRVHLGKRVTSIAADTHQITLHDGTSVKYDCLLLANGASSYIPQIAGAELGILSLRTLQDALSLKKQAQAAEHAVILGGGLLGLDLAMALKENGSEVTVVEMMQWLLPRQLDEQGASALTALLTRRGLRIITNDQCVEVKGNGHAEQVMLKSGISLPAELVAVSAGVRPNIQLAQAAGLTCSRGVVVDDYMRTSAPDIFAVGDIAEHNKCVFGIIPVALAQARIGAAALCGDLTSPYQMVAPSTTLKVTGIDLASIGEVNPEAPGYSEIRERDDAAGIYKKLVIRNGIVVGAILLGDRANVRSINTLIERKIRITGQENRLLEPDLNIASLS